MKYLLCLKAEFEMAGVLRGLAMVVLVCIFAGSGQSALAQNTLPLVAIHDSEYTRALENMPASGATPTGPGFTGKQWWFPDWRYHVMPEMIQEALRSDGTAFTVIGDSNIIAGGLLTNGQPRYPIVISLETEAIHDDQIAQFTNYVAAGGFLFVSGSAFTRTTNGTARGDFAFANAMGIRSVTTSLLNFELNTKYTRVGNHRINQHFPAGTLNYRQPSQSEEIPYGYAINPPLPHDDSQAQAPYDYWMITNSTAIVLAQGTTRPILTVQQYGNGYIIYCAVLQPLLGNGGWAPTMYSYLTFRRSIEWAFENANLPIGKLSAWPYPYDAAFMVRHDLESFSNRIAAVEASARFEYTNGCTGDYYFCTGTLREDMSPLYNTNDVIAGLFRAITNYGATIAPHNGGLTNARAAMTPAAYDYWHWGPDEMLDITPAGYSSGSNYAYVSISKSFDDVESWLPGMVPNGMRLWCAPYYNGTREGSLNIQEALGVKITGEQKIAPFPHWSISTQVPGKRFGILQEPPSDWYVGANISHSLEGGHTISSLRAGIDFYYGLGALVNFYSHSMSDGTLGNAAAQMRENVLYSMNTNRFPRLWPASAIKIYNWWLARSNVQITVSHSTTGLVALANFKITNATDPNTTIELLTPATTLFCDLKVYTNGVLASTNDYRTTSQAIKVKVGSTVTNALLTYYPYAPSTPIYSENFDAISAPGLPGVWTAATTGAGPVWVTQTNVTDTSPNAAFAAGAGAVGLSELTSPSYVLPAGPLQLTFRQSYDLESSVGGVALDAAVVEIKIGTNAFSDIITAGGSFVSGGYGYLVSSSFSNPLAGRQAWSGASGGFITTVINLPAAAAGQPVQFRWRLGSDSGGASSLGWYVDSVNVNGRSCLCCSGGTNNPALPAQTNRTILELNPLIVTNTATDADLPNDALFYSLSSAPAGASISTAGIITWTPTEAQGPSTNNFVTIATDSTGRTATNSFFVTVLEANVAPVFVVTPTNRTINELTPLIVTNNATDSDLPANNLSYALLAAPAGAAISPTGVITWTPDETQGPGFYTITTRVTDDGTPALSATNSFSVTVNELNSTPVLPPQADRTINEQSPLIVTNTATDADVPANTLTYQLLSPPVGATINTNTGVITWTPTNLQGPSTNLFRTVVTDNGIPSLNATNTFNVIVIDSILCGFTNKLVQNFDDTTPPALPSGWTVANSGGPAPWVNQGAVSDTASNAALATEAPSVGTSDLISPVVVLSDATAVLSFRHSFNLEAEPSPPVGYDGGVLEIQIGTNAFQDIIAAGGAFVAGGYTRTISTLFHSPISGRPAWSGNSGGFVTTTVNLPTAAANQSIQLRWRCATDDSTAVGGWYVDTIVLSNYVCTAVGNSAPTLPAQPNRNMAEGSLLTVTNTASDPDLPLDTLAYTLVTPPTGATVSSNGIITWTPTEAQGPGTNTITTVVTDGGGLSATNSFVVVVTEVNQAPVLPAQTNRTIAELTLLIVTNTATDDDLPANPLTYQLLNPPGNAGIDANGVITWTPVEAEGPSTNTITTVVSDGTVSVTNGFLVIVTEANTAPTLNAIANRIVHVGGLVSFTNVATDADLPAQSLSFSLINSPPAGATIQSATGIFDWLTTSADLNTTNTLTVHVTDAGIPPLSDTKNFIITVIERPHIENIIRTNDVVAVTWSSIPGQNYRLQYTEGLQPSNWQDLGSDVTAAGNITTQTNVAPGVDARYYRIRLAP